MSNGISITGEQRDALYRELLAHLNRIDDLRLAYEDEKDLEKADRLAREFFDDLRLILGGIGWGDDVPGPVTLTVPVDDLRRTLARLGEEAQQRHEDERAEQEAFRANFDHSEFVRATCEDVLSQLEGSDGG
ncbi:MAG TPA: hypothetical protein VNC16_04370 [Solirubrobacterales bacterium]|jgi:hypothetical protein|nr:hypothetical protein [Solirubrobacterales bacterium]